MTVYTATFSGITLTSAGGTQDLFELVPNATTRLRILEVELGQYTDFGDAQAEIVSLLIMRGHTTSGSGGSSVTPGNLDPYSRASVTTVERNNTTLATGGSPVTLLASTWHIQAGFLWRPPEDPKLIAHRRQIIVQPSQRLVVRMNSALADDVTANGTVTFEEIGKAPVS